MKSWPGISIVTPLSDGAQYVEEAVESVMRQDYPNVEHIVIDGGSSGEGLKRLSRYPHLKLVCEPDRGAADAINKGFGLATGDIWAVLRSDDMIAPGALRRVAHEVDPRSGRHIVMGRCRFVDEQGHFIGIEHPSHFESHRRVLEVWRGRTIPAPSVFWTPEVWRTCGPADDTLGPAWMSYDLFCRFSQEYGFNLVDQVLAECRLQDESRWPEAGSLEVGIGVSRRYWGSPLSPRYWTLALSLARFRFDRVGRARRHLGRMEESRRRAPGVRVIYHGLAGMILAPEVALYVAVYPRLRDRAIRLWKRTLGWSEPPETTANLYRTEAWEDGWVGPRAKVTREIRQPARVVALRGWADLQHMKRLVLTIRVDDHVVGRLPVRRAGHFSARIHLADPVDPGVHTVVVEASTWFVPHRFSQNGDLRPLAWRVGGIDFEAEALA